MATTDKKPPLTAKTREFGERLAAIDAAIEAEEAKAQGEAQALTETK